MMNTLSLKYAEDLAFLYSLKERFGAKVVAAAVEAFHEQNTGNFVEIDLDVLESIPIGLSGQEFIDVAIQRGAITVTPPSS